MEKVVAVIVNEQRRGVVPGSPFLDRLYQGQALDHIPFYLFFGYQEGKSRDGTIALRSQEEPKIHLSAPKSFGFPASHMGILNDVDVRQTIYRVLSLLDR